jgi:hypothetical protein
VLGSGWEAKEVVVEHVWFYKWNDFEVPSPDYFGVKVSCLSVCLPVCLPVCLSVCLSDMTILWL